MALCQYICNTPVFARLDGFPDLLKFFNMVETFFSQPKARWAACAALPGCTLASSFASQAPPPPTAAHAPRSIDAARSVATPMHRILTRACFTAVRLHRREPGWR